MTECQRAAMVWALWFGTLAVVGVLLAIASIGGAIRSWRRYDEKGEPPRNAEAFWGVTCIFLAIGGLVFWLIGTYYIPLNIAKLVAPGIEH